MIASGWGRKSSFHQNKAAGECPPFFVRDRVVHTKASNLSAGKACLISCPPPRGSSSSRSRLIALPIAVEPKGDDEAEQQKTERDAARAVREDQMAPSSFSPCGRRCLREAKADEGSLSAETDPSPVSNSLRSFEPPSPARGEGKEATDLPVVPICRS